MASAAMSHNVQHYPDAKLKIISDLCGLCASVVNSFRTVRNAPATLEWVRVSVFALAADFAFAKDGALPRSLSRHPHRTDASDASSDVFSRQPTQPAVKA